MAWTAGVLCVVLLLGVGGLYGAYRHYGDKVATVAGLPALDEARGGPAPVRAEAETYLIVGSDSADGLTREQLRAANTSRKGRDGTRTDTVLLLQVPADGSRARVLSFPRDSWVPIPGHGMGKISMAYDLGEQARAGTGPGTLIATVQGLSGLSVDHYVEVSLYGFVRITDALGGVQVCLSAPAVEEKARINLPAGRQRLNGQQALAFVRQRRGVPGGDLGRIRRQQHVLSSVARDVLSAGTLLDPLALGRLLDAVTASVRVDPGTDRGDLLRLGLQVRGVSAGNVRFQTVPVANADARVGAQSVVLLDTQALPDFFADRRPAPGSPPSVPAPVTVPPSAIGVVIENGTSTPGLGGTAAAAMSAAGFRILSVRDAARLDHTHTVVRHGADRADSARTAAAGLPGATTARDDSLGARGLVVTLGTDYRGVVPVKVLQEPPGSGSSVVPRTAADDDCVA